MASSPPLVGELFYRGGGDLRLLIPASPFALPPLPPPLLPPLHPLPPRTLCPRGCQDGCGFAGVWPLCGPPPGGKLIVQATMARDCSSGSPLPPKGVGAPSPTLVPPWASPLIPSPLLHLAVGGGAAQVLGFDPHLLYQAAHKGRARLLRGPPPPLWAWGCSPPPHPVTACRAMGAHADRGVPPPWWPGLSPPSPSPACCALGAHAAQGVPW